MTVTDWPAFRIEQAQARQTVEVAGRYVWLRGGEMSLLATFATNAEAVKTLKAAGYRQKGSVFTP